jgi:hypothetical protein
MTEEQRIKLRKFVLYKCRRGSRINEIIDAAYANEEIRPIIEEHGEERLRRMVSSLREAGLLMTRGQNKGMIYRTSQIGGKVYQQEQRERRRVSRATPESGGSL